LKDFSFEKLRDFELSFEHREFSFEVFVLLLLFFNKFEIPHGFEPENSALFFEPGNDFLKRYSPFLAIGILGFFLDFVELFFNKLDMIFEGGNIIRLPFFNNFLDLVVEVK
jgi:hypothetical protein